jgi:tetratricopeptide (TPR) repeat protein
LTRGEIEDELIAAELHNLIGVVYRDLGLWDEAERHIPVAVETRRRLLGEEHPSTLQSMHEQLFLERYQGVPVDWEPRTRKLLETRKRVLGAEHPDTLTSMDRLAVLIGHHGQLAEAEPILVRTLAIRRRVLGSEHRDTLLSIAHLGLLYAKQGRIAEAEPHLSEALDLRTRVLGEDHPDTLVSMDNLIRLYENQGRFEEAEPLRVRLTDGHRRVVGAQHPYTLRIQSELGPFYEKMERYDDARAAYETELQLRRNAQGVRHPRTWRTMRALTNAYLKMGRDVEALALCRELLEHLPARATDPNASSTALFTVAWVLTRDIEGLRNPEKAVDFAQHAVNIAQERKKRLVYQYLDALALAQHQAGNTAQAIETEKRAISRIPKRANASDRTAYEAALRTYESVTEKQKSDATESGDER